MTGGRGDRRRRAGAGRSAGCRRAGSRRPPAACRCAPSPGSSLTLPSAAVARTVSSRPPREAALEQRRQARRSRRPPRRSARATRRSRRPGTAAAECPCRPGCCGGCARSSRRSPPRTPSRRGPFAAQSRDDPEPYSLPARMTSGTPLGGVLHRGVEDRHQLAVGQVPRHAALGAGREQVPEADVGERAAHHHLVVAAAGAVAS